jgi:hypothetical protein
MPDMAFDLGVGWVRLDLNQGPLPYQGCSPIGSTCANPGPNACQAVRE